MRATELRAVPSPAVEKGLAAWAHRQYVSMVQPPWKKTFFGPAGGALFGSDRNRDGWGKEGLSGFVPAQDSCSLNYLVY